MLGYRKQSFSRAHALLQALQENLEDLATLKELQELLLCEIIRAEENIRKTKAELKVIRETENSAAAKRSRFLENRIEGFRKCAYVWRCFGDGIAFLYMDRFALKQCFYRTENTNAKQDAGFIAGKEGLADELILLDSALEHNVPALLVDLTNTIRHGDICLMGEPDPYLIEVKASKKLNQRGKRQQRSLEKLRSFFETDNSKGLRGFSELRRQVYKMPLRTHVDQINECIVESLKSGYAVRNPEPGLYYIVLTQNGPDLKQAIGSLNLNAPWAFSLNQAKSDRAWAPYLPFTLTIECKDHLWSFIRGDLFILVLIDLEALCQIALDKGYDAKIDRDDEAWPLRVKVPGGDGMAGISDHILARIGMEFVSPSWIVLSSIEGLERTFKAIEAEHRNTPAV